MSRKKITTLSGWVIEVDTEACLEFGFRAGDRVEYYGKIFVVEGVSGNALWLTSEEDNFARWSSKKGCKELKKVKIVILRS